ncbi:MAG: prepilin-type N-terminal cleavage/methylation domain-containing protein [Deltaproteobacteria bacterium]|nr:prepilin-type N-terminal cleavage/methylation domain-containing protein [Deltaproteobacteria bacterium]
MIDKDRGFTLIEVLASLSVMGIALLVIIRLLSGSLALASGLNAYSGLVMEARERMNSLLLDDSLVEGEAGGVTEDGVEWHASVKGGNNAEGNDGFISIEVRVTDGRRSYTLTTLKASPPAKEAA